MKEHGVEIFAFRVHVDCAIDGMKVETTLNEIHQLDIQWNIHARDPIYSGKGQNDLTTLSLSPSLTIPDEKWFTEVIVTLREQIDVVGPRTGVEETLPG